jgi:hypothetical protein
MSDILIRASIPGDARWSYDDPAGVAETPLAVRVPETLTPGDWLITLVTRGLLSSNTTPKAV